MTDPLPAPLGGTVLRILATSDLGANTVPLRTTFGESGTCAGGLGASSPSTVAVIPAVVAHLAEWLGRDLEAEPGGVSARDALVNALT